MKLGQNRTFSTDYYKASYIYIGKKKSEINKYIWKGTNQK